MTDTIDRPIFILGAPRSGTSVLYKKMAQHPDLAFISNLTKKYPESLLLTRLILLFRDDHRPTEAKKVWRRYSSGEGSARSRSDVNPRARDFLRGVVANNLRLRGRPRFISKDPGNSLRVGFLDEIFPDALFVHIIRDGRAVVQSAVRNRRERGQWYGIKIPGWERYVDRPWIETAGMQWKVTVQTARAQGNELGPERYLEVRYEEFTDAPAATLERIASFCGLRWDPQQLAALVEDVKSRNFKWREDLSADDLELLQSVIGDLMKELGYEF